MNNRNRRFRYKRVMKKAMRSPDTYPAWQPEGICSWPRSSVAQAKIRRQSDEIQTPFGCRSDDVVETTANVALQHPRRTVLLGQHEETLPNSVSRASARTKAVGVFVRSGLGDGCQRQQIQRLHGAVLHRRDAQRAQLPVGLRTEPQVRLTNLFSYRTITGTSSLFHTQALLLNQIRISCPRDSRAKYAQPSRDFHNDLWSIREQSALRASRAPAVSMDCPWHFHKFECSVFTSSSRPQNVPEQSTACPASVSYSSNELCAKSVVDACAAFSIASGRTCVWPFLSFWYNVVRLFDRAWLKSYLVGNSKHFRFASSVAFRVPSKWRLNLFRRVVLAGVAGRVSGLMSSCAGRAHRDCLPLVTAPKQSLSFRSLPCANRVSFALLNRSKIKTD